MKNILIFTCYEKYSTKHKVMNEFLIKNLSLFNLFDYNVTLLDRTQDNSFYDACTSIIEKPINKINTIDEIVVDDYDYFYTFGNFISFNINCIKGKEFKITEDSFDNKYHKLFFNFYEEMVGFIEDNDIEVHQFMSDPLDFIYPNTILLTPDTKKTDFWDDTINYHNDNIEFFPLYQYSHHIVSDIKEADTDLKLICGNTCFDKNRHIEFNTYLLNLYEKEKNNIKYNFLISGYSNYKYVINTFVSHTEFFELCNRSEFGLVMKTYSDSIISSNKFHTFLSKGCLPILVKDCDLDSNYLPNELREKLTVKNGIELFDFINNIDSKQLMLELKDYFKNFYNKEYYEEILKFN